MKRLGLLAAVLLVACNAPVAVPSPTPLPAEKVTFIAGFKPQADLPFVAVYCGMCGATYTLLPGSPAAEP